MASIAFSRPSSSAADPVAERHRIRDQLQAEHEHDRCAGHDLPSVETADHPLAQHPHASHDADRSPFQTGALLRGPRSASRVGSDGRPTGDVREPVAPAASSVDTATAGDAGAPAFPVINLSFDTLEGYQRHRSGRNAALIAHYGFLSVFPLMLVFTTVLGFVLQDRPDLQEDIIDSALRTSRSSAARSPPTRPACAATADCWCSASSPRCGEV